MIELALFCVYITSAGELARINKLLILVLAILSILAREKVILNIFSTFLRS
jgi:hypothetical protein